MKMIKKLVEMVNKKCVMNDKTFFLILLYTWSLHLSHSALTFLFLVQKMKLSSIDWQNKVNRMKIYLSVPFWKKIYVPLSFNVEHRTSWSRVFTSFVLNRSDLNLNRPPSFWKLDAKSCILAYSEHNILYMKKTQFLPF